MSVKHVLTIAMAVLMISSLAFGGALAASNPTVDASNEGEAGVYSGTHLSFETTADALTNYRVADTELISSIGFESASDAEQRGVISGDVGLSSAMSVEASPVSVMSESDTQVQIESESGADIEAHDSQRGHLLVHAADDGQFIVANISSESNADQVSDSRVVVTHEDGTQGTFIVIGDGEVTVNEAGHVNAELEQGASMAYKQYADERTDEDDEREQLIAEGTAAAEVYLTTAADGGSEFAADVVQYGHDTTVDVTTYSENRVEMTAERAESEGRIIITTISEEAFEAADEIEVTVDGAAAVEVSSASELEAAADGGDESAYLVRTASTADASSEVLVAINHFSERTVAVSGTDTDSTGDEDEVVHMSEDDDALPGFGAALAVLGLLAASLLAIRRDS